MNLKKYFELTRIQKKAFANMVGISSSALANYIHGKRVPRLDIAHKIIKISNNMITIEDLIGEPSQNPS